MIKGVYTTIIFGLCAMIGIGFALATESMGEMQAQIVELKAEIRQLEKDEQLYKDLFHDTRESPEISQQGAEVMHVEATAYCSCPKCCGDWSDGITYTGTEATQGRTIAVDPDTISLGSQVVIEGQTYIAEDIGGGVKGNRIDVYFEAHEDALEFGRKTIKVEVYQ